VVVAFVALVVLVVDLPLAGDDLIAIRWPAVVGVALAIVSLGCAVWTWRRPGESAERRAS
jgi:protein-S-isoprenylcysteine O-methyltransferase Ste14